MTRDEILGASSMPLFSPSYPRGPFVFLRREYLIITYETDPEALRAALPEPLAPAPGNLAYYEWMKMPDASGFGDYEESGSGIPGAVQRRSHATFRCKCTSTTSRRSPRGREIWGFPKKYGVPRLKVIKDTLTGTLHYDDERVAMGTMGFKPTSAWPTASTRSPPAIAKPQRQSEIHPRRRRLAEDRTAGRLQPHRRIHVHGAWEGPARLHLILHVNCRVDDLPVRRIVGGRHQIVDFHPALRPRAARLSRLNPKENAHDPQIQDRRRHRIDQRHRPRHRPRPGQVKAPMSSSTASASAGGNRKGTRGDRERIRRRRLALFARRHDQVRPKSPP